MSSKDAVAFEVLLTPKDSDPSYDSSMFHRVAVWFFFHPQL